jgi:DnaJ-class molecular chaperone
MGSVVWIEVGTRCDECGGSGVLPDRSCWLCFGEGRVVSVLTMEEFRRFAGVRVDCGHIAEMPWRAANAASH